HISRSGGAYGSSRPRDGLVLQVYSRPPEKRTRNGRIAAIQRAQLRGRYGSAILRRHLHEYLRKLVGVDEFPAGQQWQHIDQLRLRTEQAEVHAVLLQK